MYVDRKTGQNTDRPGLQAVLACARDGDVIVVHTPHRRARRPCPRGGHRRGPLRRSVQRGRPRQAGSRGAPA
ncbi:recombinase family protein [Quadrisphaera oryzae]|uniref:recombinase family protein n=1 Tax=Quadrisphaera TaxID=317661 RepID=UPI00351C21F0